jgi:preprotein translocase subunit YajC
MRLLSATALAALLLCLDVAAQAAPPAGGKQGPDTMGFFFMMGAIILIMYLLMFRPEQKRQKERQQMIANIKKGDHVLTTGGMYGTVGNVKDDRLMIKVGEGMVIEFARSAIASVLGPEGGAVAEAGKDGKKG